MRKEKKITVNDRGRELAFTVREMPATKLESFIVRAGLLLAASGLADGLLGGAHGEGQEAEAPDVAHVMEAAGRMLGQDKGAGLIRALGALDYDKARPLLNDLLGCCTLEGSVAPLSEETADAVIEDVRTLFTLRKEALVLNLGFFALAGQSGSQESANPAPYSRKREISVH
ncbi:MAG: hypothetical protein HDR50_06885 [Desulfovibrio sp.]|uniref:hypothetical protein n=1 Tax=Desulfovibrio sp. TaxID=885 RepID=UPI001A68EC1E|nr:hypothetical protein [Desulfovibrio sp.]MBD5417373.1 hypothetical protein [Desulfovibrio sp.]